MSCVGIRESTEAAGEPKSGGPSGPKALCRTANAHRCAPAE